MVIAAPKIATAATLGGGLNTMKTQNEIANQIGVTAAFISYLLNGRRRPSWSLAKRLSENFGHSPSWWMEADIAKIRRVLRSNSQERKAA